MVWNRVVDREDGPPTPAARRYRSLDGLRGLAALTVVLDHLLLVVPSVSAIYVDGRLPSPSSPAWWLYRTPLRLLFAGHEAVLIFFVLSGFVLTLPLTQPNWRWRAYYPRRLVRLYLPVWAAILLALALALLVTRDPTFGSSWLASHKVPTAHALSRDMTLLVATSNLDSPLWSLRWEVWFSLLLPGMFGVLMFGRRRSWPLVVLALIAVSTASRFSAVAHRLPQSWLTEGLMQYLPVFGIGMVLALNRERLPLLGERIARTKHASRNGLAVVVVALLLTVSPSMAAGPGPFGAVAAAAYVASLIGVSMILFIALESRRAIRVLETPVVQWVGTRSFSLYLVHEPVVVATALTVRAHGYFPWLLIAAPMLLLILAVTEAFYRVAERPAHRLSRYVGSRAAARPEGSVAEPVGAGR
jgi:peptidoglycan/LPS O-acetylase OafA/YrhL